MTPAAPKNAAAPAVALLLVLAAVAFVQLRAPYLDVPFTRDEGEYAYLAQRWAAGEVPYRDAFNQKPPLIFVAYRAAFAVGGESVRSVRVLHGLWVALTALVLYRLVRRAGPASGPASGPESKLVAAAIAVVAYVALVSSHGWFGHVANTEVFMLLPMTASALFLWRGLDRDRAVDWALCGVTAMLAFWFKPVAATSGLWIAGFVVLHAVREGARGTAGHATSWARLARRTAWLVGGGFVASAPIVLPFGLAGVTAEFFDAVFLHNIRYSSSVDGATGMEMLKRALARQGPELAAPVALALLAAVVRWRAARAYLAWLLFCALGVCVGLYFRPHYFMQLGPPLAALVGIGGAWLVERLARWRIPTAVGALLAGLVVFLPVRIVNADLLRLEPDRISRRIHDVNPFVEAPVIAARIEAGSAPDDRVYVYGSEPEILFHARRRSATRYIITYPLMGGFADSGARQREAIAEVRAADPKWIVLVSIATSHLRADGADTYLATETERLIGERGYTLDAILVPTDATGPFRLFEGARAERVSTDLLRRGVPTPAVRLYRR